MSGTRYARLPTAITTTVVATASPDPVSSSRTYIGTRAKPYRAAFSTL